LPAVAPRAVTVTACQIGADPGPALDES